jgi:predicted esterase
MSLFRIDSESPFEGPHQNQPVVTAGAPITETNAVMILIHGRGASAESMLTFAREFDRSDIHYRAVQAKGHTWYPRSFMGPKEMNEPGISSGLQAIHNQLTIVNEAGISTENIILLGFSQGACLTTEFAARHPQRYGGIVGLSGGLIGQDLNPDDYNGTLSGTPVFLGCSDCDPHIPKERVEQTEQVFDKLEATVTKRIYEGMGHTVNQDQISFVKGLLTELAGDT